MGWKITQVYQKRERGNKSLHWIRLSFTGLVGFFLSVFFQAQVCVSAIRFVCHSFQFWNAQRCVRCESCGMCSLCGGCGCASVSGASDWAAGGEGASITPEPGVLPSKRVQSLGLRKRTFRSDWLVLSASNAYSNHFSFLFLFLGLFVCLLLLFLSFLLSDDLTCSFLLVLDDVRADDCNEGYVRSFSYVYALMDMIWWILFQFTYGPWFLSYRFVEL